jgi:CBS domain-containing protein
MQVKEIMTENVAVIGPDASIREAAVKMKRMDIGSLPVCDGDRLRGMITDRDMTLRATAEGSDPNITRFDQAMSPGICYCFEDQEVSEAARLMEEKQIRRLAVLNRKKRLVGIVSLGDIAVRGGDEHLSYEALELISEPVYAH